MWVECKQCGWSRNSIVWVGGVELYGVGGEEGNAGDPSSSSLESRVMVADGATAQTSIYSNYLFQ